MEDREIVSLLRVSCEEKKDECEGGVEGRLFDEASDGVTSKTLGLSVQLPTGGKAARTLTGKPATVDWHFGGLLYSKSSGTLDESGLFELRDSLGILAQGFSGQA